MLFATGVPTDGHEARVRFVHASPDAPAADMRANGAVTFSKEPFTSITDYAALKPGAYQVQVTPTGGTERAVTDAHLERATKTE
jgi:hypothetical protein